MQHMRSSLWRVLSPAPHNGAALSPRPHLTAGVCPPQSLPPGTARLATSGGEQCIELRLPECGAPLAPAEPDGDETAAWIPWALLAVDSRTGALRVEPGPAALLEGGAVPGVQRASAALADGRTLQAVQELWRCGSSSGLARAAAEAGFLPAPLPDASPIGDAPSCLGAPPISFCLNIAALTSHLLTGLGCLTSHFPQGRHSRTWPFGLQGGPRACCSVQSSVRSAPRPLQRSCTSCLRPGAAFTFWRGRGRSAHEPGLTPWPPPQHSLLCMGEIWLQLLGWGTDLQQQDQGCSSRREGNRTTAHSLQHSPAMAMMTTGRRRGLVGNDDASEDRTQSSSSSARAAAAWRWWWTGENEEVVVVILSSGVRSRCCSSGLLCDDVVGGTVAK